MGTLTGRVAWITGAGSGMGRATALRFATEGARVALLGIPALDVAVVAGEIAESGGEARAEALDVTDRAAVGLVSRRLLADWGPADVLVNCAGVVADRRNFHNITPAEWDQVLGVNLTGTHNLCAAALPGMRTRRSGTILNIASMGGKEAYPVAGPAYTASKFGVVGYTHAIAAEEAQHGIRACVVCPGEVNTPILERRPVPVPQAERERMIQPDDIAAMLAFLAAFPQHVNVTEVQLWPTHRRRGTPEEGLR